MQGRYAVAVVKQQGSQASPEANAEWQSILSGHSSAWTMGRRIFRLVPSSPRCKLCAAPFQGPGAPVMRLIGKRPYAKNPTICSSCFSYISSHQGGAELAVSLLFADVRGSTTIAEGMSPTEFSALLNRFYGVATDVLIASGAIIDKFVGDEVVAVFIPGTAGKEHARRAIEGGVALLQATGHGGIDGPWIPVGAGVHTGEAYVGTVGAPGRVTDFTALGDAVNTTARLASAAAAGELLVTFDAIAAAEADGWPRPESIDQRELSLKGKSADVSVQVLRA